MPTDDVKKLKTDIVALMGSHDADSTDAAFAMAQLLGIIAAKADRHDGFRPFEERWAEITDVARAEYEKVRLDVRQPILLEMSKRRGIG